MEEARNIRYGEYNRQLDALFIQWMEALSGEQRKLFCKDGLLVKAGKPLDFVDEKWKNAPRRVAFLLKDKNTPDGDDIRLWLTDKKHGENSRQLSGGQVGRTDFLPNIARMLYGLLVTKRNDRLGFDKVQSTKMNEVKEMWNNEPFALIETKKLAGYSSVSKSEMQKAIDKDKDFLTRELNILKPNIIICCDADDSQFNFVTQTYLAGKDAKKIEYSYPNANIRPCCLWYYPTEKVIVIKSYHPTRRGKANWMIYERVISPFHELLKQYSIDY